MKEEKCPCCPNHCDVTNLSCKRGMEHFANNSNKSTKKHHFDKDESTMTTEEKAISQILKCGHFLHHEEKEVNLSFLSETEKEELISILSKCLDNWK